MRKWETRTALEPLWKRPHGSKRQGKACRKGETRMPTYIAVRTVAEELTEEAIEAALATSREERVQMSVRWVRSYYSAEEGKLYCEYEAPSLELLFEYGRRVGMPIDHATVVQNLEPSMFR
jgi:Protein of unknown function (DUF4242)